MVGPEAGGRAAHLPRGTEASWEPRTKLTQLRGCTVCLVNRHNVSSLRVRLLSFPDAILFFGTSWKMCRTRFSSMFGIFLNNESLQLFIGLWIWIHNIGDEVKPSSVL